MYVYIYVYINQVFDHCSNDGSDRMNRSSFELSCPIRRLEGSSSFSECFCLFCKMCFKKKNLESKNHVETVTMESRLEIYEIQN